jgi:hypothetical protein
MVVLGPVPAVGPICHRHFRDLTDRDSDELQRFGGAAFQVTPNVATFSHHFVE